MSSSSSWYDGAWSTGISTSGLLNSAIVGP
jgi:hypothetical protein